LTDSSYVNPEGYTITYVSGHSSNGGPVSYSVLPPSDPSWVPSAVSEATSSGSVIYSYIPTPSGFETVTNDIVLTPHGQITYVCAPTVNGGSTQYAVYSKACVNSSGEPVTEITEENTQH
jgi:hypothetical protein